MIYMDFKWSMFKIILKYIHNVYIIVIYSKIKDVIFKYYLWIIKSKKKINKYLFCILKKIWKKLD